MKFALFAETGNSAVAASAARLVSALEKSGHPAHIVSLDGKRGLAGRAAIPAGDRHAVAALCEEAAPVYFLAGSVPAGLGRVMERAPGILCRLGGPYRDSLGDCLPLCTGLISEDSDFVRQSLALTYGPADLLCPQDGSATEELCAVALPGLARRARMQMHMAAAAGRIADILDRWDPAGSVKLGDEITGPLRLFETI